MINRQFSFVKEQILKQVSLLKKEIKEPRRASKNQFYESIYLDQKLGLTREDTITLATMVVARLRQIGKDGGMVAVWDVITDGGQIPGGMG